MHFIKLTRPLNLLIIVVTMYGIGWYFEGVYNIQSSLGVESFTFFLLVISTVMIAAAGNIINDYFDIKADLINKPNRVVIGKYISRRVAIFSHWIINFVAFAIALYLSWRLQTYWYLFIHLLTINLLWYYSLKLKRKFFIGNFLIAGLTAIVPLLVGYYFYHIQWVDADKVTPNTFYPFGEEPIIDFTLLLTFAISGFAFVLNLAREIVKDMEDVEGDKKLHAKTLPIVLGYKKTKRIVGLILFFTMVFSLIIWSVYEHLTFVSVLPIIVSAALVVQCFILLVLAKEKSKYRTVNHLIKLAMISGLLIPIYWRILMIYG